MWISFIYYINSISHYSPIRLQSEQTNTWNQITWNIDSIRRSHRPSHFALCHTILILNHCRCCTMRISNETARARVKMTNFFVCIFCSLLPWPWCFVHTAAYELATAIFRLSERYRTEDRTLMMWFWHRLSSVFASEPTLVDRCSKAAVQPRIIL